jgi:hypothetical protein
MLKLNDIHNDYQSVEKLFRTSTTAEQFTDEDTSTKQSMDEVNFPNWEQNDATSASFKFEFGMNWQDFSVQTASYFWKVKKEQEKELFAQQDSLKEDRKAGVEYMKSIETQCSAEILSLWRSENQIPKFVVYEEEWNWLEFKDKNFL